MAETRILAELRGDRGTRPAKRLRREGKIPGVIYGHGIDAVPVAVEGRDLRHALTGGSGLNTLLTVVVGDDEHIAMARQIQRDPTRHVVTHIDFLVVNRNEIIASEVPVLLVGEAKDLGGEGVIEQALTTLTIHSKPGDIPPRIEVDITGLQVGDQVSVGDLALPQGVTTDLDPTDAVVVARVSAVSLEIEAEEAEAEAEAAEGGTGPTEGDAPAGNENEG